MAVLGLCLRAGPAAGAERGDLAGYSNLFATGLSSALVNTYLMAYGMGELTPVPYGVAVCRIQYWTLDAFSQELVLASGAVQLPLANGALPGVPLPLLMYAHGTESYRWNVPSCPHGSPNGPYSPSLPLNSKTIEQLAFSSAGYCVVAPDYAGLGFDTNSLVTPYLLADREPLAVIDALRAARQLATQINVALNGRLFLTGYSQGGHVCLATHRLLEQDYSSEFRVTAATPGGAPADLSTSLAAALDNHLQGGTVFASFAVASYQSRYRLWNDFSEVFLSAYTNTPYLFYGAQLPLGTIAAQLPTDAHALFTPTLLEQMTNPASVFAKAIASNNVYQWRPRCPVAFFYAGGDTTVAPTNSVIAHAAMQALGADVNLVNVGDTLNHATGFGPSEIGMLRYCNRYRYTVSPAGAADFDGDGKADPAVYDNYACAWRVKLSASGYALASLSGFGGNQWAPLAADFDGDGLADPTLNDGVSGAWQVQLSAAGYSRASLSDFGCSNYPVLTADFDGDGKADPAWYKHDATAGWTIQLSGSGYISLTPWPGFGGANYIPLAADFDGDSLADPAIYQVTTGTWRVMLSAHNYGIATLSGFGGTGCTALAADFDGDGRADPAIYMEANGTWLFCLSASGYLSATLSNFGGTDYTALAADFDGDSKADPAIWQASAAELSVKLSASGYVTARVEF